MVIVHDRVPDMKRYPPLPDIFLDNVPYIPWAFHMCEWTASLLTLIWITVLIFHKHRYVIAIIKCIFFFTYSNLFFYFLGKILFIVLSDVVTRQIYLWSKALILTKTKRIGPTIYPDRSE